MTANGELETWDAGQVIQGFKIVPISKFLDARSIYVVTCENGPLGRQGAL